MSEGHFNQGEAYYRAGEWSKARTEFQASYEISRLDLLLFNIAQTYIKEGDSVRAIAALKAYLKTTPSDADAQAKLASLEAALPQSAQAPPSQTQALPIPTRAPSASQTPRQTRKLLFLPLASLSIHSEALSGLGHLNSSEPQISSMFPAPEGSGSRHAVHTAIGSDRSSSARGAALPSACPWTTALP